MDKASIIKDAIEYIQQLQAEERRALRELEAAGGAQRMDEYGYDEGVLLQAERAKRLRRARPVAPAGPVEVLELRVAEVGERVLVVSVTCGKGRDAMARVCRAVEELRLRVITASITSVAGCLMHTIFVEVIQLRSTTPTAADCAFPLLCCFPALGSDWGDMAALTSRAVALVGLAPGLAVLALLFQKKKEAVSNFHFQAVERRNEKGILVLFHLRLFCSSTANPNVEKR